MIHAAKTESVASLAIFKKQYMQMTTAPLDGMWLCGFVPMATHFSIYFHDELIGFYCVNDEGYLLQFFLSESHRDQSIIVFDSIVDGFDTSLTCIKGAFVSTAEPYYLSLCLDRFSRFEVNALMYRLGRAAYNGQNRRNANLTLLDSLQLAKAVDFAVATIGAPAEGLAAYYTNLIVRQELYGLWREGQLIATGERRGYDEYQTGYSDVGVIVAASERGKGLATWVLKNLVMMNEAEGLESLCSTLQSNVAARKAISRAGFVANNRIVQFHA